MTAWNVTCKVAKEPKLNNPVLIAGLPGIGNVGKVAVDFIADKLGATQLYEIYSHHFPHSVFINEDNICELPTVSIMLKKGKRDLLFLVGDVQPSEEQPSYEFAELILDLFQKVGGKQVITLGGIGLPTIPKKPKVYCTGNSAEAVKEYSGGIDVERKLYGVVGPIIGISGLLLGLSSRRKIPAVSFLAETYGHPMYLGMKGAREIVAVLNQKLDLKIKLSELDKEITKTEEDLLRRQQLPKPTKKGPQDVSYIG